MCGDGYPNVPNVQKYPHVLILLTCEGGDSDIWSIQKYPRDHNMWNVQKYPGV